MSIEIQKPQSYSAGLYVRLSKEDENQGQSESVSNQLSLLMGFARERGILVFDSYIDDGYSGTSFDRPGFLRLIADIEAGRVNMVITKDLSRLGRDYILTGHYMERYFPEHQVRYISLLDGIDTGVESTANDITPFRAIMNDMYAKDISKKIKSVKRDKQRLGLFIGGKPVYGYKMHPEEKNKIVADEKAAATVRRIFGMALEGISCRQIASALNSEGVETPAVYAGLNITKPGPYTGLWSSERISDMLQNETYIGSMVQGRSRKISYKSKKCVRVDPEDWVVVEGTHEPLVTKEEFQKVSMLLSGRRHTRSRTYDFLLKGLIHCHECGCPLAVINRPRAGGEDCLYFVCRTYQRFTKAGACTCHSVKEERVRKAVIDKVSELCGEYLSTCALLPMAQKAAEQGEQGKNGDGEHGARRLEIEGLTLRLDKIYSDRLSGILEEEDFKRLYLRVKAERKALEEKEAAQARQKASASGEEDKAAALAERFIGEAFTNKELLFSLIERIEYSEDKKLYISFRFRQPGALS